MYGIIVFAADESCKTPVKQGVNIGGAYRPLCAIEGRICNTLIAPFAYPGPTKHLIS